MDTNSSSLVPGTARADFLESLLRQISGEERSALLGGGGDLRINPYNRATMVRMLEMGEELEKLREAGRAAGKAHLAGENEAGQTSNILSGSSSGPEEDQPLDLDSARALHDQLQTYLNLYMADQPQAHKWIILACLFSAFLVREPMHPQEMAKWVRRGDAYACPAKEVIEDSLCRWCPCWGQEF